ncbi:GNAT family N-acetyltransferase [Verrucomicrobiota bacterium sgz303538]
MSTIEVQISDKPSAEETETVLKHLKSFNQSQVGDASARELAVIARDGAEIVAGLLGLTHWNWLHVRFLWVAESVRYQGLGSRLLRAAEREARIRGGEHVHLDTFSFQALPFYEKHGYSVFGSLDDYPTGHRRFFLQKRNLTD